jgi:hypothetical protein
MLPRAGPCGRETLTDPAANPNVPDETDQRVDTGDGPTACIPPQTPEVAAELRDGDTQLLHCLDCGRQMVARRHAGGCMLCGSEAIVIETP